MVSTGNKLDLTVFKLIGDQYEGVLFVFDIDSGKFVYLNDAIEPLWKRRVEEVTDNPSSLLDSIHPEDRDHVTKAYEGLLEERVKVRLQFRIVWPYTTDIWIRQKVFPLEQKGKVHWIAGMAEDDSSRMENIFNMQKINARKDSMMEILSHDLRGPIGIVQSLAALIEEDLSTVDIEQSREQLQLIQKICKRNIDLIRDLVHQEFLESAQVDSMKFMQVINNLISNSIKFTHDDGIISIHIEKKEWHCADLSER